MPAIHISKKEFNKLTSSMRSETRSEKKPMKNKLSDLNLHLFEQLERLNDEDLTEEQLAREISRSKAITDIAQTIISNANTVLKAVQVMDEAGYQVSAENPALVLLGESVDE